MNAELTEHLARLVRERSIAALGTLRAGFPCVSMVPYAIAADGPRAWGMWRDPQ